MPKKLTLSGLIQWHLDQAAKVKDSPEYIHHEFHLSAAEVLRNIRIDQEHPPKKT